MLTLRDRGANAIQMAARPKVGIPGTKDAALVDANGTPVAPLPQGVTFHDAPTHCDERGTVTELFDKRWNWHPGPVDFVYSFSLRPGKVKGWGMHLKHEDRYFVLFGEMKVVMFDDRQDSPSRGLVAEVALSHYRRRLMNIPAGIWHLNWNIGQTDVVVVNFPTMPYDHANPDKYRLPLDTDKIPYRLPHLSGF